jgi:hypothetical protein
VPHRAAIKYLTSQRDMEVWLAPVAGTRVLVPFRVSIPTPVGTGVMQATQVISAAQPPTAATGVRIQLRLQPPDWTTCGWASRSQLFTGYPQESDACGIDSVVRAVRRSR